MCLNVDRIKICKIEATVSIKTTVSWYMFTPCRLVNWCHIECYTFQSIIWIKVTQDAVQ
jgi:hypothetical protein